MNSHCLALLDMLGFIPVFSKAEQIVSESIKRAFENLFGHEATLVLLHQLGSFYGLSEKELTTNYDIFEKSLCKISSYGAKIILRDIRKEILIETIKSSLGSEITEEDILNPDVGIADIIKKISYREITKFVNEIPPGEHLSLIYENENTKDKVLSAFLSSETYQDGIMKNQITSRTGLISNKQTKFNYVNNILYCEDLSLVIEKSEIINRLWQWMNWFRNNYSIRSKPGKNKEINGIKNKDIIASSAIRIAIEDAAWFLLNNLTHEFLSFEKIIKKYIDDDKHMSVLCTYRISTIPASDDLITKIIECHDYVILENPLMIYKSTKRRPLCRYHCRHGNSNFERGHLDA
jgi:hypothetical protein